MKRKLWWRLAGIAALTLLLLANIIPFKQLGDGLQASDFLDTLRPGIDLAGGTRLLYQVNVETWTGVGGESPAEAMIRVLKTRVDPTGALNLIWRPVGTDRVEIIIPRATASSTRQRDAYQSARDNLLKANIRLGDIESARQAPTAEARRQAFLSLARGVKDREELLTRLHEESERLRAAEQSATTQPELDPDILEARAAFDHAARKVMDTNVKWLDVYQVLKMGPKEWDRPTVADDPATRPSKLLLARYESQAESVQAVMNAHDAWRKERQALDDPNDLKRLLQGTGVLEFHLAVAPDEVSNPQALVNELQRSLEVPGGKYRWFESGDPKLSARSGVVAGERLGTTYVLAHAAPEKSLVHSREQDWKFKTAHPTRDQWGSPAVAFQFDELGGQRFAVLTGRNLGKPLAAVLDGKVISIATIQSKISTNGEITGSFTVEEVTELAQKLQAGALPGSLSKEPVSENEVGPQLGEAHRRAGFNAALIAVIGVFIFMGVYYLAPLGLAANIAVMLDLVFILGVMARGSILPGKGFTFTLPGIAGIALTIGMAVDANVLINERIREEQERGASLRTAVKNGYSRALSAILDSNITTLITTVILYMVGTAEIKGFAITLGIGVVASMFTAVFVTRVLLQLGIEYNWISKPFRMLKLIRVPSIRWMDRRYVFWGFSALLIAGGMTAFFSRDSRQLYDVEFLGGTKVQVTLAAGRRATDGQIEGLLQESGLLPDASVHTVVEAGAGGRQTFEIMTNNPDQNAVKEAVIKALKEPRGLHGLGAASLLPERAVLKFARQSDWAETVPLTRLDRLPPDVHPVTEQSTDLGLDAEKLNDYLGGLAIIIDGLEPATSLDDIQTRIRAKLAGGQFDALPSKGWEVIGLEKVGLAGPATFRKVLYVVRSDQFAYDPSPTANNSIWMNSFALPEVQMVHLAVSQSEAIDSVNNFSPSVAKDVKIQALIAIILSLLAVVIYVWVRFGNVLFGVGSIVPLFHDVAVVVGLVAISKFLAGTSVGRALLIHDFRFDLTVVAAVLTVIGYSLNDNIVVFDRIRENRGRLQYVTRKIIDDSINQTMSRTILTGLTTMVAVLIMYVFGGSGIHAFSFAMLVGLIVGTYSSIAIASPFLLLRRLRGREGEQAAAKA